MKRTGIFATLCALTALAGFAVAADANLIPNRLSFAKVGEWASYTLPDGYTQRLTVTNRTGVDSHATVTVLIENIYDGDVVTAQEITEPAGDLFASPHVPNTPGIFISVRNQTAEYKGKHYPVGIVEINSHLGTEDESVTEYWTNADVPVFGIVKKVENGETAWQLADFGAGEGVYTYSPDVEKALKAQAGGSLLDDAKKKAAEAAATVSNAAGNAVDEAKTTAADAADRAYDVIRRKAQEAKEAIGRTAGDAKEAVVEAAGSAREKTADLYDRAKEKIGETVDSAGTAIDRAVAGAKEEAKTAGETAARLKDSAADKASAAGSALSRAAETAKEEIKADAKAAAEAIDKAIDSIKE